MNFRQILTIFCFLSCVNLIYCAMVNSTSNQKSPRALVRYNSVVLNASLTRRYNPGENLVMHCPVDKLNLKIKNNQLITHWYKNEVKLTVFNLDELSSHVEKLGRVKLLERKLKIKELAASDSAVYMCEIITGTGLSIKSNNLTLIINELETSTKNQQQVSTEKVDNDDYETHIKNEDYDDVSLSHFDFNKYVKGEAPIFQDNKVELDFSQLEKSQVELDCTARGTPSPQTHWLKNGKIMSEEEYGLIRNVMTLRLKDVQLSDSANYTCQVSNQFGKLNRTFTLKVLQNLKFVGDEPSNKTVSVNSMLLLKCQVEPVKSFYAQEAAQINWFFRSSNIGDVDLPLVSNQTSVFQLNGETFYQIDFKQQQKNYAANNFLLRQVRSMMQLKISSQLRQRLVRQNAVQLRDGSLLIERVSFKHAGQFLCFANNSKGFNYRKAFVKVVSHVPDVDENFNYEPMKEIIKPALLQNLRAKNDPREIFNNFNVQQQQQPSGSIFSTVSTPIVFIVSISLIAIAIIICLMYFYKSI